MNEPSLHPELPLDPRSHTRSPATSASSSLLRPVVWSLVGLVAVFLLPGLRWITDAELARGPVADWSRSLGAIPTESTEQPLVERSLPGLKIAVPEWEIEEQIVDDMAGTLVLAAPSGRGQSVKLTWMLSESVTANERLALLSDTNILPIDAHEIRPVRVAGVDTEHLLLDLSNTDAWLVITPWSCPEDPRAFSLQSLVELPPDDHVRLHARMLSSVRCETLPNLRVSIPELDDLARTNSPNGVVYTTEQGDELLLTPPFPGANSLESFLEYVAVRRGVVRGFGFEAGPGTFETSRPLGPLGRLVWDAVVNDPKTGERLHVLLTAFECGAGRTHLGLYASTRRPGDGTASLLASARCPQPDDSSTQANPAE